MSENIQEKKAIRPWLRVLIAFSIMMLVILLVMFIYKYWSNNRLTQTTDNAYVKGDLNYISTKINGYVTEVLVTDNQSVKAGDVLAEIDQTDYISAVEQAKAKIESIQANKQELEEKIKLAKAQIQISKVEISAVKASQQRAASYLKRTQALVDMGGISRVEFEKAQEDQVSQKANAEVAQVKILESEQNIRVLESQRAGLLAEMNAANAGLKKTENDLRATKLIAPNDGTVVSRKVRVGEYVSSGKSLMVIAPSANLWIEANLKETQISKLKKGDQVLFTVDAIPDGHFCGTLESISKSSGSELALLPADNATGNFTKIVRRFPVKIVFNPQQKDIERLAIGMSVIVDLKANTQNKVCQ